MSMAASFGLSWGMILLRGLPAAVATEDIHNVPHIPENVVAYLLPTPTTTSLYRTPTAEKRLPRCQDNRHVLDAFLVSDAFLVAVSVHGAKAFDLRAFPTCIPCPVSFAQAWPRTTQCSSPCLGTEAQKRMFIDSDGPARS